MAVAGLLSAAPAMAQPPAKLTNADAVGFIGWFNADKSELTQEQYANDWYNRSLYAGAAAGWYWTDHLKTEVDVGITSRARLSVYNVDFPGNSPVSRNSTYRFGTSRVAVGQHYQFLRNAWVHPFIGAGVDVTWEQTDRTDELYPVQIAPREVVYPRQSDVRTRPFVTAGIKGYFAERAFIRTDLKLVFDRSVDEALFRFGIGVDF
jgi:outer membrane protein W